MALGEADFMETRMANALMEQPNNLNFGDERLHVSFELYAEQDADASAKAARPIYSEKEYIKIIVPGPVRNVIHREATDMDKRRFAKHYDNFKKGMSDALVGTPLNVWPAISRALVEELKFFGIHTVEQLASMNDNAGFAGAHTLKKKAQDFLAAAKGNSPISAMRAEMEQKDQAMNTMQQALDEMKKQLLDLQKRK